MSEKKILVFVDDEKIILSQLLSTFEEVGYTVKVFSKADEAVTFLTENHYDLVCTDMVMPVPDSWSNEDCEYGKKTGIQLARTIKNRKPDSPIMALTVAAEDHEMIQAMHEAGISRIVSKPVDADDLIAVVKEMIWLG